MVKLFQILAVIFAGIAAFFLWRGNTDGLFISAVLGAVCFFLGIRFEVGARVEARRGEEKEGSGENAEEFIDKLNLPAAELSDEQLTAEEGQRTKDNLEHTKL